VANARTVLVIEDNLVEREGLAAILRQEGYGIVLAVNGKEALERLQAGASADVILLDMVMAKADGWEFLKLLPKNPALLTIPIIIVTGLATANLEWARALGAVGLIHKPIDVKHLKSEVARVLTPRS
jgi:CheY-like chemotaxis protein